MESNEANQSHPKVAIEKGVVPPCSCVLKLSLVLTSRATILANSANPLRPTEFTAEALATQFTLTALNRFTELSN